MPMSSEEYGMLQRIDERTISLCDKFDDLETRLTTEYVSQKEFYPVKTLVYGCVGSILLIVITAMVTLIIKGGHF